VRKNFYREYAKKRRSQRAFLCGTLCLCAFVLTSCDIFSTRDPEPPDLGSQFIWTPASTPTLLLQNFEGTVENLDASNYVRCFVSEHDSSETAGQLIYTFVPRSGLDAASQSVFQVWTTSSEQSFMTKLRTSLIKNPRATLTFINLAIDQPNGNTATVNADYSVVLPVESDSPLPTALTGSLQFQLESVMTEQATREWRIVTWTDFTPQGGGTETFTDLKLQLSL
jgi:hypothetical protein